MPVTTPPISPFTKALTSVDPQGLLPYMDAKIGLAFEGLEVKNYGFTGGLLDLNRLGSGYRLPTARSSGYPLRTKTRDVVIARIFPTRSSIQGVADVSAEDFYDFVEGVIKEWVVCKSGAFNITTPQDFEISGVQDIAAVANLQAGDPRSRWHVLSWKFELSLYR